MNWDAIGAMGEILGAAAVVLTLFYLARQVRTQNRASEIDAYEGIMNEFNEMNRLIASDKALYRLFIDGMNRPDALDDDQAGRVLLLVPMLRQHFPESSPGIRAGRNLRAGVGGSRRPIRGDDGVTRRSAFLRGAQGYG